MSDKPNIILINCDDLGYGDLGCYGSEVNNTPYLDKLAAGGKRFTDFYMASAVCTPSRAAMMTGCYPPRIGMGDMDGQAVLFPGGKIGLNPSEKTVASYLKDAGYSTKIIGKWHCGDQHEFLPTNHGFDEYYGIPYSNDMGRQANNPDRPPLPIVRDNKVVQEQPDQRTLTERYTVEANEFISANQDKPFFLYFAHMYVHVPLFVPKRFMDASKNGGYGGAVECIDWSTGLIMDHLEQLGLTDNTLVIFTSDNGSRARGEGGSNKPCSGHKGQTLEGGIRVPCIMRWPNQITAGTTCDAVTRSIDLLPTFANLAGVDVSNERTIDGADITCLLTSEDADAPNDTFFYYWMDQLRACRVGDWKLHLHQGYGNWGSTNEADHTQSLFNLREDVGETNDVINKHPDIVDMILKKCDAIREEIGDSKTGVTGKNRRPSGRKEDAKPMTKFREDHPYMVAMYDLADMPTLSG